MQEPHAIVLEGMDTAIKRLNKAHAALTLEASPDAATVQAALTDLGTVREFWCGVGPNIDVAHSLRVICKSLEPVNHHHARAAYGDLCEVEGIVQDNTVEGNPISRR
jgi:hypothetical protein